MANIFSKIKNTLSGSGNESLAAPQAETTTGTPITDFKIKGMKCVHCQAKATSAIKGIPGVTDAHVDLESTNAHIEGTATREQIEEALKPTGFTAEFE